MKFTSLSNKMHDTMITRGALGFRGFKKHFKSAIALRPVKRGVAMFFLARHSSGILKFFHKNPAILTESAAIIDAKCPVDFGFMEALRIRLLCHIKFELKLKVTEIEFPENHKNWGWFGKEAQEVPKALRLIKAATNVDLIDADKAKVMIALRKVIHIDDDEQHYVLSEVSKIIKAFEAASAADYGAIQTRVRKLLEPEASYLSELLRRDMWAHLGLL